MVWLKTLWSVDPDQMASNYLIRIYSAFKQDISRLSRTNVNSVKPVLSGHSKIDTTMVLMENGCLMKVESIAECSPWSILQYF